MKKYYHLSIATTLICASFLYAQEIAPAEVSQTTREPVAEVLVDQSTQDDLDILRYGLEADVLSLLQKYTKGINAENPVLDDAFATLFADTERDMLKAAVFNYFAVKKDTRLFTAVEPILKDYQDMPTHLVQSAIRYAAICNDQSIVPSISHILANEGRFESDCLFALTAIGGSDGIDKMVEHFKNNEIADERLALISRQNTMLALVESKDSRLTPFFQEVVEDAGENPFIRAKAAAGLAQTQSEQAVPVLIGFFAETNPLLRKAAIESLSVFHTPEAKKTFFEGFRDGSDVVRLQALQSAEDEGIIESEPYVLYRAKTDPEMPVRLAAIKTLASFKTASGYEWLKSRLIDPKENTAIRIAAGKALITADLAYIFPDLDVVLRESVQNPAYKQLRYALGKAFSEQKTELGEDIALAYLQSDDVQTMQLGLDMYVQNRYPSIEWRVFELADSPRYGTVHRRAKKIIDQSILNEEKAEK